MSQITIEISIYISFHDIGFEVCCNGKKLVRGDLHSCVFDTPARCIAQHFIQFNGYYGCATCLSRGKSVKTLQGTSTQSYPFDFENLQTGHGPMRTHQETIQHALQAEREGKTQYGVHGMSWLVACPMFDIIRGVTIDYMHCVCLGVVKKLIILWTNSHYKHFPWYVGNRQNEIDKRLHQITPPNRITRLPRSIKDISNWKATEYRNFLLHYAVPILYGILPERYFNHLACLIEAISALLASSISRNSIGKKLSDFAQISPIYTMKVSNPATCMPCYICLRKYAILVHCGPTLVFFFEDLNRDLRHMFHGTQNIADQIIQAVFISQKLPELSLKLTPGSPGFSLYEQMQGYHKVKSTTIKVCDYLYCVAPLKLCNVNSSILALVKQLFNSTGKLILHKFERLLLKNVVIHSKMYDATHSSRRNSYTVKCMTHHAHGSFSVGLIQYYLKCEMNCEVKYVGH